MPKAVITGFGVVSALGAGKAALTDALIKAKTGVAPVTLFDTSMCRCHLAAQVHNTPAVAAPASRIDTFLAQATAEAIADAGLSGDWPQLHVFQGTAHGALDLWEQAINPCAAQPVKLGQRIWQSLAEKVSIATYTNACVASTWAAGMAMAAIRRGEIDLAIVAGADVLTPFLFRGFDALRSLTLTHCRPFDKHRDGLVLGEGAAVLILESDVAARRRGAPIRAELAGFGVAADAYHLTAPDPYGRGVATALTNALADAEINGTVDYINLHGTGTTQNDRMEIAALHRILIGANVPLSATKGVTGHTSGAVGIMEIAICLCALAEHLIPTTLGLTEPDPACGNLNLVHGAPRALQCHTMASINSAFGGNNAAVVLRSWA